MFNAASTIRAGLAAPSTAAITAAIALVAAVYMALTTGDVVSVIEAGRSRP